MELLNRSKLYTDFIVETLEDEKVCHHCGWRALLGSLVAGRQLQGCPPPQRAWLCAFPQQIQQKEADGERRVRIGVPQITSSAIGTGTLPRPAARHPRNPPPWPCLQKRREGKAALLRRQAQPDGASDALPALPELPSAVPTRVGRVLATLDLCHVQKSALISDASTSRPALPLFRRSSQAPKKRRTIDEKKADDLAKATIRSHDLVPLMATPLKNYQARRSAQAPSTRDLPYPAAHLRPRPPARRAASLVCPAESVRAPVRRRSRESAGSWGFTATASTASSRTRWASARRSRRAISAQLGTCTPCRAPCGARPPNQGDRRSACRLTGHALVLCPVGRRRRGPYLAAGWVRPEMAIRSPSPLLADDRLPVAPQEHGHARAFHRDRPALNPCQLARPPLTVRHSRPHLCSRRPDRLLPPCGETGEVIDCLLARSHRALIPRPSILAFHRLNEFKTHCPAIRAEIYHGKPHERIELRKQIFKGIRHERVESGDGPGKKSAH